MTWFHFPFNKNQFSFFFCCRPSTSWPVCTNPKCDRSLQSCLKVTQCSTSEIGDAPLYNSCSLPIQVMTTGPLPAPSKCNRDVPRVMKTKFPATVMVFGVVSSEGHIMPPHIFEVGLKVNTNVYLDVLKSMVAPWVWQQDSAPAHMSKETQAWLQGCYDFVPFSHWPPPPPTWTHLTTSFGHTSRTSPTWPPTTPKPAWSPPSTELPPALLEKACSQFRIRIEAVIEAKAATLNRYQLYYITKLTELIFSIKVFK